MSEPKYPYPEEGHRTHWEGCYRERRHHNCAVARVDQLTARVEELETYIKVHEATEDALTTRVAELEALVGELKKDLDGEFEKITQMDLDHWPEESE